MQLFSELIDALVEYSIIDRLIDIKEQLERDLSVIGPEERIIAKYTMVCNGIEKILDKHSKSLIESVHTENKQIIASLH